MMLIGGRCGYAEPTDDGAVECFEIGLRITVRDPFGNLMSIVRCIEHSDWIETGGPDERGHAVLGSAR